MSEKEWEEAYREAMKQGRSRVGDPPTPEEMMAHYRGDLPPHEENRIHELLAYYPDLVDALLEEADPRRVPQPYLTEQQLAQDWSSLRERLKEPSSPPPASLPFKPVQVLTTERWWQWSTAAAALVCVVLGGLYFRSLRELTDLRNELRSPRIDVERISLYEGTARGSGDSLPHQLRLLPTTRYVSLNLTLAAEGSAEDFRVEVIDLDTPGPRTVWTSRIYRDNEGTFTLEVPRSFLTSTNYRLNLYASNGAEPIARYLLRVMPSSDGGRR